MDRSGRGQGALPRERGKDTEAGGASVLLGALHIAATPGQANKHLSLQALTFLQL